MYSPSKDNVIHVKLFGTLELKNTNGQVIEPRGKETISFRLLKYLLIEPTQEVYLEDALPPLETNKATEADIQNTIRVYLHRAKGAVRPLQLDSAGGFVDYHNGKCGLNPKLILHPDVDEFVALMKLIGECLQPTSKALALYGCF